MAAALLCNCQKELTLTIANIKPLFYCVLSLKSRIDQMNNMRTYRQLFGAALLLITISSAKAVPIYGTFSGIVTSVFGTGGYPPCADGDTVTGIYEYTPALLTGGATDFSDPTANFQININGTPFAGWSGNSLNLIVGANGEPVSGSAAGGWQLFLGTYGPGDVGMTAAVYSIGAEVTYSTPSATVPDTASTFFLSGIALLSVAVFGRLTSRLRSSRLALPSKP